MKYECKDCGMVFEEYDAYFIPVRSFRGELHEADVCPNCRSENLEDYKEPEQEEDRELTEYDKQELRGEYWCDVERGN